MGIDASVFIYYNKFNIEESIERVFFLNLNCEFSVGQDRHFVRECKCVSEL